MIFKFYTKLFVVSFILLNLGFKASAQTTEDFEDEIGGQAFTSNGIGFTLTNALTVFGFTGSLGYNHSTKFLVNTNPPGPGTSTSSSIKPDGGNIISVQNLWIFTAVRDGLGDVTGPSTDGTVTFTGKLAGATQFTVTKTSGFATSTAGTPNGFSSVNFATDFGSNVSAIPIDELVITLNGNFDYFQIDNFTWSITALPVSLISYTAVLQDNNTVRLDWTTNSEINNSHFTVERSTNGNDFSVIGTIRGNGTIRNISEYTFTDQSPAEGINYYRLKQYDLDGKVKDHGVRSVNVNGGTTILKAYPNPVVNSTLTLQGGSSAIGTVYRVVDIGGRTVLSGKITQAKQDINVNGLQKGMFVLQLSNGTSVKLVKN